MSATTAALTRLAQPAPAELDCPFPITTHPRVDALAASTQAWAERHGLLHSARERELFRISRWHLLAAMAYPRFSDAALDIAGHLVAWIIMFDEACLERSAADGDYTRTGAYLARCQCLFEDPDYVLAPADAYLEALREPLLRLRALATPVQMHRFASAFLRQLYGNACELPYLFSRSMPSLRDYLAIRNHSAGAAPFAALIDIGRGYRLPDAAWSSPRLRRLVHLGGDLFGIDNDVTNYWRDTQSARRFAAPWNLVEVIALEYGVAREEALERACAMHRAAMRECAALCDELARDADARLAEYAVDFRSLMVAPREWYRRIERYRVAEEFAEPPHGDRR